MVVGAYLLLRPHLLQIGAYIQRKDLEKQDKVYKSEVAVDEIEEAERETDGLNWGAKARIRRKIGENRIATGEAFDELDSDEDIADLLTG